MKKRGQDPSLGRWGEGQPGVYLCSPPLGQRRGPLTSLPGMQQQGAGLLEREGRSKWSITGQSGTQLWE